MDMDDVIHVDGLTKFYGTTLAVNPISFQIKKGEVFGFLGPIYKKNPPGILTPHLNPLPRGEGKGEGGKGGELYVSKQVELQPS